MAADELVSVGQAAGILGVHVTRIDQLIREGRLPAVRLPPSYRLKGVKRYVRRADVEALLAEKQAAGHKPKPGRPKRARQEQEPAPKPKQEPPAVAWTSAPSG